MTNALQWIQSLYPVTPFTFFADPLQTSRVKEETKSGYVMADMGGPDDPYHLTVGLRNAHTSLTDDQNQLASADPSTWGSDSWNGVPCDLSTLRDVRGSPDFLPRVNDTFFADPLRTYRVKEETKSGYVMADMGGLDDPYHLNVGLRIVNTSLTVD